MITTEVVVLYPALLKNKGRVVVEEAIDTFKCVIRVAKGPIPKWLEKKMNGEVYVYNAENPIAPWTASPEWYEYRIYHVKSVEKLKHMTHHRKESIKRAVKWLKKMPL